MGELHLDIYVERIKHEYGVRPEALPSLCQKPCHFNFTHTSVSSMAELHLDI